MTKHQTDLRAALTGLIVGAACLFTILFTIVQLVNRSHAAKAESGQVSHQ